MFYDSVNSPQLLDKLILKAVRCPCVSRTIFIKSKCFSTIEVVSSEITFLLHPQFQSEPSGKYSQHNIYSISIKTVRTDAWSSLSGCIIAIEEIRCWIVLFISITDPDICNRSIRWRRFNYGHHWWSLHMGVSEPIEWLNEFRVPSYRGRIVVFFSAQEMT